MARIMWKATFQEKGIELQMTAKNLAQAQARFDRSCELCTHGDCSRCGIRTAFLNNAEYVFESEWTTDIDKRKYVELEKALA